MTLNKAINVVRSGGQVSGRIWHQAMNTIEREAPDLHRELQQAMLQMLKARGVRVNADGWISYDDLVALFGDSYSGKH